MPSYTKNKQHIYNYVELHRAKYNQYQNEYRLMNKEHYNEVRRNTCTYKKSINYESEVKRLMSIKI